jgi:hypothetical protein
VICVLLLQAAAASAAPQVPAAKHKGRGSKSKAAQQAAAAGGSGAEAAAAAAAAILEDGNKLQLAGLVAVMGKLASAEPLVSVCVCVVGGDAPGKVCGRLCGGRGCPRKGCCLCRGARAVMVKEGGCHGQKGVGGCHGGGGGHGPGGERGLSWSKEGGCCCGPETEGAVDGDSKLSTHRLWRLWFKLFQQLETRGEEKHTTGWRFAL